MNLVGEWAATLVHGLAGAGVTDVIVSPGSRSTPLVLAAAAHPGLRLVDAIDERAAAFFALGQARVTGRPSLLLCTSGSAPAHYHPAIVEADRACLPVLALSADRPWELHDAGANQTVDQTQLFGRALRWFFDVGAPDAREASLRALLRVAGEAVARALAPVPGPVHLNARLRKPLEPGPAADDDERRLEAAGRALRGRPVPRVAPAAPAVDEAALAEVAAMLERAERPWLVAGPSPASEHAAASTVGAVARRAALPLLAESTSQLRYVRGARDGVAALDVFDPVLRTRAAREALAPDLVVQLGATPVSGALPTFLEAVAADAPRVHVAPHLRVDAESRAAVVLQASPGAFARAILPRLGDARGRARAAFAAAHARAAEAALGALRDALDATGFTEAALAAHLPGWLPAGSDLVVGNSLPIRQLDAFAPARGAELLRVLSQRGTSGIDGLVAGAAGAASASGRPTALLVGDVSFVHDLSALALARAARDTPLALVVVRNGGGRIFDQLPIAGRGLDAATMAHFTTPLDPLDLAAAARAFGVRHAPAGSLAEAEAAVRAGLARPGPTVVEVAVPGDGAARALAAFVERLERSLPDALR